MDVRVSSKEGLWKSARIELWFNWAYVDECVLERPYL